MTKKFLSLESTIKEQERKETETKRKKEIEEQRIVQERRNSAKSKAQSLFPYIFESKHEWKLPKYGLPELTFSVGKNKYTLRQELVHYEGDSDGYPAHDSLVWVLYAGDDSRFFNRKTHITSFHCDYEPSEKRIIEVRASLAESIRYYEKRKNRTW